VLQEKWRRGGDATSRESSYTASGLGSILAAAVKSSMAGYVLISAKAPTAMT